MTETRGRGEAALVEGDVEFDARDAALLRAIAQAGSVARAASELDRSRARALTRIEALEAAFGSLVRRQRGGRDGGGSRLTETARDLLNRYERLRAALDATAQVPETVLYGDVTSVDGELALVETQVGTVRGLHDGSERGQRVQVRIGADAITVLDNAAEPDPDATSARNRVSGEVVGIDRGETVVTAHIEVGGTTFETLVTSDSEQRLGLREGCQVTLTWKATATRIVGDRE
ncbi:TOBE domain-containing protein [Natranaeroarchaeum aerophilus]|uniref:TOBE domain-containing protein n=1 Tax=Natranaeroarchaeum aerophilus TaxID=2917711 RepID=A0AAE3K5R0_9EURY|nr:TOBE domain-containing protein [Natranaeroarchaeum aerophilus]